MRFYINFLSILWYKVLHHFFCFKLSFINIFNFLKTIFNLCFFINFFIFSFALYIAWLYFNYIEFFLKIFKHLLINQILFLLVFLNVLYILFTNFLWPNELFYTYLNRHFFIFFNWKIKLIVLSLFCGGGLFIFLLWLILVWVQVIIFF